MTRVVRPDVGPALIIADANEDYRQTMGANLTVSSGYVLESAPVTLRRPVIYIAGPYRSDLGTYGVKKNIDRAWSVARKLWALGFAVICPHTNTAHMDGHGVSSQDFLDGDLEILRRCDGILMLPDWLSSDGAIGERNFALKEGISVYYMVDAVYLDMKKLMGEMVEV